MNISFPGSARTIIKSRIRNHPMRDQVVGSDPALITNASVADLTQYAIAMGLEAPTDAEIAAYDAAKKNGASSADAMDICNVCALNENLGGPGLKQVKRADTLDAPDGPKETNEPDASDADPVQAKAETTVRELQTLMGRGDFDGFKTQLMDLAVKAHTPAPTPAPRVIRQTAPVDASKIKGHVPQVVASKTMADAGIKAKAYANTGATVLDVYDAPDAPAVDTDYVWTDYTASILVALSHDGNVFLAGPAGTGKTTFAKQIAARYGRPFVRISCNDQTDAPTLLGMPGLKDGNTQWEDGQLTAAIRRPGTVVLIDEISSARPGAAMVLQGVLDADRTLQIPDTGEIIPVAPGVLFFGADNTYGTGDETGAYEGTRVMNRATLDRFDLTVPMEYLPVKQEAKLLSTRTGLPQKSSGHLCRLAAATRKAADKGDLSHGLGFRRLEALARQIHGGASPDAAYNLAVITTAPYDDREALRQLWTAEIKQGAFA